MTDGGLEGGARFRRNPAVARPRAPEARSRARGLWFGDLSARALVIACVLNLNGVAGMTFGMDGAVSVLMAVTAIVLVVMAGRYAWSPPLMLLMAAIIIYLLLGLLFHEPAQTVEGPGKYLRAYGGALPILWGLAGYVASLRQGPRLSGFLVFLRNTSLIAAASVWASPILYEFYVNLPFSFEQRMGGFFANPNEAAMVAVLAVVLTLGLPFRNKLVQLVVLAMASIAVFMTLSKTGMSCLIIVLLWNLVSSAKWIGRVFLVLGAIGAILLIQDTNAILHAIADNPALQLDPGQKNRILAVGQILGGQIDESTTTGRSYLWGIATDRALDRFPLGNGLGSGHHLVGGMVELGNWQGAHNTFLMMWAESGVLPLLLLLGAMISAVLISLRHGRGGIALMCLFVLLMDMMATHGALSTRYHNAFLAIVLGLLAGGLVRRTKVGLMRGMWVRGRCLV